MGTFIAVAVVGAALLAGCGPHCDDAGMRTSAVDACAASGNTPAGGCACEVDYIYERNSCDAISRADVPLNEFVDACNSCAAQYGTTCS